jgi:hypothetical protein
MGSWRGDDSTSRQLREPMWINPTPSTPAMNALAAQQKFYVRVDDQTDGQLLFIGISVVQQPGLL